MDQLQRRPFWCCVLVAPLAHGVDHRPQITAAFGQPVVEARRVLAVGNLGEHADLDEASQALTEHVAGDPEPPLEVVKAGHAEERVADDQQRPPLAHHLQTLRDRAMHVGKALPLHALEDSGLHDRTQCVRVCVASENSLLSPLVDLTPLPPDSSPRVSTLSQLSPAKASRPATSPRLILVIVCAGVVLASLDLFIVN